MPTAYALIAQESSKLQHPTQFSDYPLVANLDSLEQVVYAQKANPSSLLTSLITLEINRRVRSEKFGQDLNTIEMLAIQHPSEIGLIMYEYLRGINYWKSNLEASIVSTTKVANFFEKRNDTLGMMSIYFQLVGLNTFSSYDAKGNKEIAQTYYQKLLALGQNSTNPRTKFLCLEAEMMYEYNLYDSKTSIEDGLNILKEVESLIDKNPELGFLRYSFYNNMGIRYLRKNRYSEALTYHIAAYQYAQNLSPYVKTIQAFNLATAYYYNNNNKIAQKYYLEAAELYEQAQEERLDLLSNIHNSLADVLFNQRNYTEAWRQKSIADSIYKLGQQKLRNKSFMEIQTKYETEKKKIENKSLQLSAVEQRNKIYFLSFIVIILMSALVLFLWINKKIKLKTLELTRLSELISDQNQHLIVANRRMEHFTNALSHDALGYINHIINYMVLVQKHNSQLELNSFLEKISQNANKLKRMSENLIRYNKNKKITNLQPLNLDKIIREAFEDVVSGYYAEDINLEITNLPNIYSNQEFIKELFRNLLSNSLKFRKADRNLHIKVSSDTKRRDGFAEIQLEDNGCGIQSDKLPLIFDEFIKINETIEGSGLGLSICKQIVNSTGGEIWVKSTEGLGTTFYFTLPLYKST